MPLADGPERAAQRARGARRLRRPRRTAHETTAADRPGISAKQLAFRNEMRRLWEDHVVWTRMAVIGLTSGSADTQASVDRLLANQDDIRDAIEPFYGAAAGDALAKLLRSHILVAADVIAAAKAGDQAPLADAQRRWEANADEIAAFLSRANPRQWNEGEVRAMMHEHLRLTTNEVVARLRQDRTGDVAVYDAIHGQILHMADMLSTGIVAQFPRRVPLTKATDAGPPRGKDGAPVDTNEA